MKHSFVRIAAASPALKVADPAFNAGEIVKIVGEQKKKGTEILVFPELSLSGYTCGDLFLRPSLTAGCLAALRTVARATEGSSMLVFVGLPFSMPGGKLYNCAAAISDGAVKGLVPKCTLPNYGEFYEMRHFTAARAEDEVVPVRLWEGHPPVLFGARQVFEDGAHGIAVACEICEDLWAPGSPAEALAVARAQIIVNLSASNETVGKREYRHKLLAAQSGKTVSAYVYCDAGTGESTSDMVFSGNNIIYENGVCLAESKPFSGTVCEAEADVGFLTAERTANNAFHGKRGTDCAVTEVPFLSEGELTLRAVDPLPFVPHGKGECKERAELILTLQSQALSRRLAQTGAETAVLGISGGLDSALALLVTARAFDLAGKPRTKILAYTMPCFGTTEGTRRNAHALIRALGATAGEIPIADTVRSHFKDIGHREEEHNTAYENAQARYRTMILMDIANERRGIVVGTGDLSELALGWCTYNGDHMSMYAVNGSVPKTLVKHLVRAEAERLGGDAKEALEAILGTEISPELLPPDPEGKISQKTEDIIGPYELHDFYLWHFVRRGDSPAKTLCLAERAFAGKYGREELKKWLVNFYRRFFSQQFKRNCVPDGVKVGSVSLSPRADWRMPSDASAALWLAEAESL